MIYSITGKIVAQRDNFVVLDVHGVGFKIFTTPRTLGAFSLGSELMTLYCHLQLKEDGLELYGFKEEAELNFFELLISISGVGPRSALAVLQVANLKDLAAAIQEGRPDILTKASGIGRKTAERIIVELRGKVKTEESEATVRKMSTDADLVETLISLGYSRDQARAALAKVEDKIVDLEARLKAALKVLSAK